MRAPGLPTAILAGVAFLLAPLLAPGCASDGGSGGGGTRAASSRGEPAAASSGASAAAGSDIMAGWMDLREGSRSGRLTTLTLVSENRQEGKLIQSGRARMDGGKVVDAETAAQIAASFDEAGFDRFCLSSRPTEGPSGALGVVWIDRGRGVESLFLLPGARQDPRTRDLPDVYDALKKLILYVHQSSPGSMVVTGEGWSGDDMMNQKPERPRR
ncbi:MAG: hypothetical protein HUU06_01590 [Planctomycetaceae bacterium]|nr:hypothetical protein [Planctomycetaceae bacterium]